MGITAVKLLLEGVEVHSCTLTTAGLGVANETDGISFPVRRRISSTRFSASWNWALATGSAMEEARGAAAEAGSTAWPMVRMTWGARWKGWIVIS